MATLSVDSPPAPVERTCAGCGAPLVAAQDWCLRCGAGAPGAIGTPSWRSAATALGVTAILALGAAAAAYAALSKGTHEARVLTTTVAQTAAPTATTPTAAPTATAPTATAASVTPGALGTMGKAKAIPPLGTIKPPKIPLTATTPEASTTNTTPEASTTNTTSAGSSGAPTTTSTTTAPSGSSTGSAGATAKSRRAAILLDTNAASTYNPEGYPASWFGDPSLTIDGDTATAWTAQVNPATAQKMAEGVLIDLNTGQKLSALELITSTPGMTVQVFGANGQTAPASIADPAWVALSRSQVVKKRHVRIGLRRPISDSSTRAFTFVTLWISRAPAASIGSAEAPGHVSVNELELFPAS